jgi:SWI/SNF-related matrix-associated actin-dependent regulator of chromatin subfamily B protein 1
MPDREPIRTHCTLAMGFSELDPSTLAATMVLVLLLREELLRQRRSPLSTRWRQNGTLHMPQSVPLVSQPTLSASKKKPKGLFRAPSYPSSILHPRARVSAPTASAAAKLSS